MTRIRHCLALFSLPFFVCQTVVRQLQTVIRQKTEGISDNVRHLFRQPQPLQFSTRKAEAKRFDRRHGLRPMTRNKMFSFRVHDLLIEQQLDAMWGRSNFVRCAVTEKLSSGASDEDVIQRLRPGLLTIVESSAAILHTSGDDIPEHVRAGLIGIGDTRC